MLHSKGLLILVLIFRSLILFVLIFAYDMRYESNFILLLIHKHIQLPQDDLLKDCHFPIEWSWHPCEKSIDLRHMDLFLDSQFYSINLCIYPYSFIDIFFLLIVLAALGLYCCARAFFSCGEGVGLLFIVAHRFLITVISLVEHSSRYAGFSSCSMWAQ